MAKLFNDIIIYVLVLSIYSLYLQVTTLNGGKINIRENEKFSTNGGGISPNTTGTGEFKRKLSKREKKELKKQEKINKLKNKENSKGPPGSTEEGVAEKLYTGKRSTCQKRL